jgi:hypothetical protein
MLSNSQNFPVPVTVLDSGALGQMQKAEVTKLTEEIE